jgi:hypothetical protein
MKKSIMNAINGISSIEEMNEVIGLIKIKQKQLKSIHVAMNKNAISVGSKVKVTSRAGVEYGKVLEIKRTKAIVMIDGMRYNCPISIMEAA